MFDVIYMATTLAFFTIMIAYVRACAALGDRQKNPEREV